MRIFLKTRGKILILFNLLAKLNSYQLVSVKKTCAYRTLFTVETKKQTKQKLMKRKKN